MKSILIHFIPHSEQRYPTCGDYEEKDDTVLIRISRLSSWRYEMLVLIHELIELCWARYHRVPFRSIDTFDMQYEKERKDGKHQAHEEPGNDHRSPYYNGHQLATSVERITAIILGVNWKKYELEIESL